MSLKTTGEAIKSIKGEKNIDIVRKSLDGLSDSQKKVVVESSSLTDAQKNQLIVQDALTKAQTNLDGARSQSAKAAKDLTSAENNLRNILQSPTSSIEEQAKATEKYNAARQNRIQASKELAKAEKQFQNVSSGKVSTSFSTFGTVLSGLKATLVSVLPQMAAMAAIGIAIGAISDKLHEYDNNKQAAQDAASTYASTQSDLSSVNDELSTTQSRIEELQKLSANGRLSMTDEAELQTLKQQNAELERKKTLLEAQAKADLKDTVDENYELLTDDSKVYHNESAAISGEKITGANGGSFSGRRDVIEDLTANLKKMKLAEKDLTKLENERQKLQDKGENTDDLDKRISDQKQKLSDLKAEAATEAADIQTARDELAKGIGSTYWNDDYQKAFDAANAALLKYESDTSNATPLQKDLKTLQSFFNNGTDSRSQLQSTILDKMAESGKKASDVVAALGISLDDLGVENVENLNRYFDDLSESATKAQKKAKEVDGTLEGIAKAAESANEGADFENLGNYLKSGKDLYDKGLVGTDDFKTIAKFIDPDGKKYKRDFADNYEKLQRYFTTNDDGEYTKSGINNFVSDLASSGKEFKNTAEVADQLGISVRSVEAIMGRLGDYDITKYGSFKIKNIQSVAKAYDEASSNLDKLKTARDGIEDSDTRDALSNDIDEFEKYLDGLDGDLSKFDPEIAVKIKAELDEAQIRAERVRLKNLIDNGNDSHETLAEYISTNERDLSTMESGDHNSFKTKNGKYKSWVNDSYVNSRNVAENLSDFMGKNINTLSDDQITDIQQYKRKIQEAELAVQDSFAAAKKSGKSVAQWKKEAKKDGLFAELISLSEDADNYIKKLGGDTSKRKYSKNKRKRQNKDKDDVSDDSFEEGTKKYKAKTSKDDPSSGCRQSNKKTSETDETVKVNYEIASQELPEEEQALLDYAVQSQEDPEDQEALMNYVIEHQDDPVAMNALLSYIKANQDNPDAMNALMDYIKGSQESPSRKTTPVDYTKGNQINPDPKDTKVDYNLGLQQTPDPKNTEVNYTKGSQEAPSPMTTIVNYVKRFIGGDGTSPATGTAFSESSTKIGGPAKASGDWSVGKSGRALVNEVGPEIISRKGRWFIHNGGKPGFADLQKDDIVFNAAQTRDLLNSGKASSYGKFIGASHANGTVGGMSFASGSGEDKVLSNFQEWFGKFFDWIEIRLDRVERKIDNVITKAESAMNQQRWQRSENLYRKGISYTIGQIGRETTVQGRYKDKADSVLNRAVSKGLINNKQAKAIRKQVKDGSLNIKSYGDRMQEVIKDYKEFYDKSLDAADAIQELKDKVLDYVDALEELHEAQMQAKLDVIDSLDDINTSTQNYTAAAKAAQLRYANDNLEKQNDAYKTRVEETRKDYGRAQNSAENAAKQQSKAKRHKGTSKSEYKKYKKAVKSAQAAIKSGKEVSSSDLSVIENYAKKTTGKTSAKNANKLAAKIIKYNAERQALDEAKLARDVAKAENNADIISNIQDIYDAMDDEANDQIDLLESQADVATTLEEKNKLLKQASSLYDTMLSNDDAEIAEMASGVNSAAKKIAKSTAYGKAINSASAATRKKVEALVQECKRRAASGEDITDDMISQLAEYNSKGYVWRSFYNACLQYHQYYQAKLQAEAQKKIDEASFKAEKEALAYQAFQNIQESYERQQQQYDNEASIIDAQQSKNQALGYGDSAKYYTAKQKAQLAQNESMRQELNALQASLSDLTVGSDEYYDALDAINDLTVSLIEGEAAVAEYQQSINQLNWDRFDELQDRISNLTSETDFLIDLLSYKDLQDKDTGNDTEYGKAVKALHVQNYQTYTQQAKDYAEAIKELDEQFADDSLNKDYLDRRQELVEAQQDAIIAAQDEKESLIDLVQDGYDAQLDALDKLISKYSDVLNAQKDIYDYQQNIKDITKDITTYQKQLQAYQYDDSEEAKQRIQQANQNLMNAQQDLSDAEYDQYISAAQDLLSDLEDELSDHFDDIIDSLRDNADDLINSIDANSADVSSTIKEATDSVGYTMSDAMTKIWGTDSEYGTISASVSAAVTGIKTLSSDINAAADKIAYAVTNKNPEKNGPTDKDPFEITGFASGGVVGNSKKILSRNGDTDFTINTLKAGERVLTPEQNQNFEKLVSFAPDLMDAVAELPKVSIPVDLQSNVSQIDISSPINIEFTLPNVQNYSEFMNEMQKDKRVEKWLTSMLVNPLTGKSSMSKNNIRF